MITIILLSHNNPSHLKRALSFYKQVEFKGRILIADSSREEIKTEVRNVVNSLEERLFAPLLLEYNSQITFPEKIACATQEIATSYALLAGVDDFFSPQTMYEAMWFLKQNKDYEFVYGKMYGFTLNNHTFSSYYTGYFDKLSSFEKNYCVDRLKDFFPRYNASFYSIFRTDILQKISKQGATFINKLAVQDNLFVMLALIEGKSKFIPKPFHWRELSDDSYGSILNQKWLIDASFKADFEGMKKCLEEVFVDKKIFSKEEASFQSNKLINEFFTRRYNLTFPLENSLKIGFKKYFPKALFTKLLSLKCTIKNNFIDAGESYLYNKKYPYYTEFMLIKELVKTSDIQAFKSGLEFVKQLQG